MRACILTIGNEILKGKTVNTNAAEIGRFLYFSGYEVYRVLTVPDVKEEIGEGFRSLIGGIKMFELISLVIAFGSVAYFAIAHALSGVSVGGG